MEKTSPVTALMAEYQVPMTRDNYIRMNNLGKQAKVSPEEEAEMPTRFAYPVVTHEELPEQEKPKTKPKVGAEPAKPPKDVVKHFNGKVFKSPAPEEPTWDNASSKGNATRLPVGVKFDKSNPPAMEQDDQTREF